MDIEPASDPNIAEAMRFNGRIAPRHSSRTKPYELVMIWMIIVGYSQRCDMAILSWWLHSRAKDIP